MGSYLCAQILRPLVPQKTQLPLITQSIVSNYAFDRFAPLNQLLSDTAGSIPTTPTAYAYMPWSISFIVWGDEFRPSRVPFKFTEQHDPGITGTLGRYRGQPVPYGKARYDVPPSVPNVDRLKHIVETFEPLMGDIQAAGATNWDISIGRFYNGQCNEGFSLEDLKLIIRLKCGFSIPHTASRRKK